MDKLKCYSEVGPLVLEPCSSLLGVVHSARCVSWKRSFYFDGVKVAVVSLATVPSGSEEQSKAPVIVSRLLCSFEYSSRCLEFNLISWSSRSYLSGILAWAQSTSRSYSLLVQLSIMNTESRITADWGLPPAMIPQSHSHQPTGRCRELHLEFEKYSNSGSSNTSFQMPSSPGPKTKAKSLLKTGKEKRKLARTDLPIDKTN